MIHSTALSRISAARPIRRTFSFLSRLGLLGPLYRQRRSLHRLSDDALRDIGLTRQQVESEAARLIWDVPAHWTR